MHIYSVSDHEFKSYGCVWNDVPSNLTAPLIEALAATPIPEGSKYVASAPELEGVKDADKLGFLTLYRKMARKRFVFLQSWRYCTD